MDLPNPQPLPLQAAWILTPLSPLHVELVEDAPAADLPHQEPPDLLVESFCEV